MQTYFGIASGVFIILGSLPYIWDVVVRRRAKPERAAWLIWAVLSFIAFVSQLAYGAGYSLILPGIDTLVVLIIFTLSFKYGFGGLTKVDIISLTLAAFGLWLWYRTRIPLFALAIIVLVDILGTYLTIQKIDIRPRSETSFIWITSSIAGLCSVLAVPRFDFVYLLYPTYYCLACGSVAVAIYMAKRRTIRRMIKSRRHVKTA